MLKITDLEVSYGHIQALQGMSLEVPKGKIVSIIGSNGAGKTTLLNTISGLIKSQRGKILYKDKDLSIVPHHVVRNGLVHIPEGRKVFAGLTVKENLVMGGFLLRGRKVMDQKIQEMYEIFPKLEERKDQQAGTLSGGEQQMLAIARGLMSNPEMILLDEPSLGLAPIIVNSVFQLIKNINQMGLTILLVEQNAKKALALSDYAYVLENGKIVLNGRGCELLCNEEIKKAYLGEKKTDEELCCRDEGQGTGILL